MTAIKERINRRGLALFLVFGLLLSGTGLSSLATIQQNLNVAVTGTATTLNFRVNDTTPTFAVDFSLLERGDIRYVPIRFSNPSPATGYVTVSTSPASPGGGTSPYFITNGTAISDTTKLISFANAGAANCNAADLGTINWATANTIANAPIFSGSGFTLAVNATQDYCLVFQVGGDASLGAFPAGGTQLDLLATFKGYYP